MVNPAVTITHHLLHLSAEHMTFLQGRLPFIITAIGTITKDKEFGLYHVEKWKYLQVKQGNKGGAMAAIVFWINSIFS